MSLVNDLHKMLSSFRHPIRIFQYMSRKGLLSWMPDEVYLKIVYKARFGIKLDLENPRSFNEKLQWLKLHDRNPEYIKMVDKIAVKARISDIIGSEYIVPTLGVWNNVSEIDFSTLPEQFVLKCNHDQGSVIFCKDKSSLNISETKKRLRKSLRNNAYNWGREWPYKHIIPRIFSEPLLVDDSGEELKDYKVLCFNGKAKYIELHSKRFSSDHIQVFFDINWNRASISQGTYKMDINKDIKKPKCLSTMLMLSEKIASLKRHVRIDWYIVDDKLLFSEFTLYDGSGFCPFDRIEDDLLLGDLIDINLS